MLRISVFLGGLLICQTSFGQGVVPFTTEFLQQREEFLESIQWQTAPEIVIDTVYGWKDWTYVDNYTFGKDRGSLPMIADLKALHPYFRDKVIQLISKCEEKGITLAIVETYRTRAKQYEYRAMGKKYTRATGGKSKHQYGIAVDVVPIVDSAAVWNNKQLWRTIGLVGERLGLRWGGRWRHLYDPGHFEWPVSKELLATRATHNQSILPEEESYPCLEEDLILLTKYWNAWEVEQSTIARNKSQNP